MATQLIGKVVGPPGADGADGADAEITSVSASATGLTPGSSPTASVTAGGTPGERTFAFLFGIPAGAKGDPGDDGQDGPNRVTGETATTLTGVLAGDGGTVTAKTVDSSPDASHTSNLISSSGVANALAKEIIKVDLGPQTGTGGSVTWSKSGASAITAEHEVLAYELGTPGAQVGDLNWTTSAGAISVSGNINGTTTLTVILGIVGTTVT